MRETGFIDQNKEKWSGFERVLDGQYKDPEALNDLFIHITDDLSYSRTFYPNRSVRVYLNGLAQRIFLSIYKNRKSQRGRLVTFWTDELPQLFYEARGDFRLSFLVFLLSFAIGVISCAMDPGFAEVILGEDYIEMTLTNIESGDPMAVYKQRGAFGMSLGITINNLYVAFLTFVLGVFFTIGSLVMIIRNGIMVGAFQYFFIERGLFWDSFLTIWTHGTLEISAIIIAGAAGITMGRGLVFPGTFTRLQSFQRSARRGVKMMIGIVPVFILAGFIEGYLTRHTETPDLLRGFFIAVCLFFVLVYFVWFPNFKASMGFGEPIRDAKVPPDNRHQLNFSKIKSAGEVFSEVFVIYKKYLGQIFLTLLLSASLFTAGVFLFAGKPPTELFDFRWGFWESWNLLDGFLTASATPVVPFVNVLVFAIISYAIFNFILREEKGKQEIAWKTRVADFGKIMVGTAILQMAFLTGGGLAFLVVIFGFEFLLIWLFLNHREGINPLTGFGRALKLTASAYGRGLGLLCLLLILGLFILSLIDTSLTWFYLELINWLVNFEQAVMDEISIVAMTFIYTFLLHFLASMLLIGFSLLYYSLLEISEAPALLDRINSIGSTRRIRGMERE